MACNFGENNGCDGDETALQAEMNVTPFIDVALVLLIIFMIAAPLATSDIPLALPKASRGEPSTPAPIYLTMQKDQSLYLEGQLIEATVLPAALAGNQAQKILIRADKEVDYGSVMALLNQLSAAGFHQVGLVGTRD
ncbi:biopolymer transporter ExbD [Bartonella sp. DGB2]|uniref:biopolymer transporter ExbD n=1 Tax=Bartonella sp. DGB2 TaxID=3388426 RepID=UPI00398FC931